MQSDQCAVRLVRMRYVSYLIARPSNKSLLVNRQASGHGSYKSLPLPSWPRPNTRDSQAGSSEQGTIKHHMQVTKRHKCATVGIGYRGTLLIDDRRGLKLRIFREYEVTNAKKFEASSAAKYFIDCWLNIFSCSSSIRYAYSSRRMIKS